MKEEGKWSTYESNVQAYRGLFLSSQSIFLAIGAITLEKSSLLTFIRIVYAKINIGMNVVLEKLCTRI